MSGRGGGGRGGEVDMGIVVSLVLLAKRLLLIRPLCKVKKRPRTNAFKRFKKRLPFIV